MSRVTNDRHGCLKSACPNRSECPFYGRARPSSTRWDINDDLLLADASMGGGVICRRRSTRFTASTKRQLAKKAINQFAADHQVQQALWWLGQARTPPSAVPRR